jgi:hypothetical protein
MEYDETSWLAEISGSSFEVNHGNHMAIPKTKRTSKS